MTEYPIVFFSKMAQAVPSIGPLAGLCGGVFVSNRRETLRFYERNYPGLPTLRYLPVLKALSPAYRALRDAKVIASGAGHQSVLGRFTAYRVMLFHGTYRPLTRRNVEEMTGFDHVLLNGPRMERMLLRCSGSYSFRYSVTGYVPFSEFPAATAENKTAFLGKLGVLYFLYSFITHFSQPSFERLCFS